MKRTSALFTSLLLGACASAPDIADWPPRAPAIEDETVQKYVDIYAAHEPDQPRYGPDDIDALNLLSRRMLRNGPPMAISNGCAANWTKSVPQPDTNRKTTAQGRIPATRSTPSSAASSAGMRANTTGAWN